MAEKRVYTRKKIVLTRDEFKWELRIDSFILTLLGLLREKNFETHWRYYSEISSKWWNTHYQLVRKYFGASEGKAENITSGWLTGLQTLGIAMREIKYMMLEESFLPEEQFFKRDSRGTKVLLDFGNVILWHLYLGGPRSELKTLFYEDADFGERYTQVRLQKNKEAEVTTSKTQYDFEQERREQTV